MGSLGCLAMQGGLLANLLVTGSGQQPQSARSEAPSKALAILLFLAAKVTAYTALGALLGGFGSMFSFSPSARAVLMIGAGLFMVVNGLRVLTLHPLFRSLVLVPPGFIRRFIRRGARSGRGSAGPLILGTLTVLVPCGVAQAMMVTALSTGDPRKGAAVLFAFTLGSTPVFFAVVYAAARLGSAMLQRSAPVAAVLLMGMGLIPINQGLTLAGSAVTWSKLVQRMQQPTAAVTEIQETGSSDQPLIQVTARGYLPKAIHLKANHEVVLNWTTLGTETCARTVVIPGLHHQFVLPLRGQMPLRIPPQAKGTTLDYSCSMGMFDGRLIFDRE